MLLLFGAIFFIYCLIFIVFHKKKEATASLEELKISVIIAAKNEQNNIKALIDSLSKQNYSKENYEVVIIDDHSTDSTSEIANKLARNEINLRTVKATEKKYLGKRGALQLGIEKSEFEYILITDGDCIVGNSFLKSFSNKFTENYDFVFGVAPYTQSKSILNKVSCFDNLWVHILTFSFANMGLPYSAAARSFGFNKKAFLKIKGFENTLDTLSGDDDLLLREAIKRKLRIGNINDKDSYVFTKPQESFKKFINQKSRHTSTSNYYLLKTKLTLGLWHLLNILILFSIFLINIFSNFLYLLIFKFVMDIILIKITMKNFSYKFNILEIIPLQIVYELSLIVFFIKGIFSKNKW